MNRVIIIDDEPLAISLLRSYLEKHDDFEIIAECPNGFDGLKSIQTLNPDLIFLDIQMPKINGFEMLELLDNPPSIIFTTAFDEFAIRAFESNAVDYLLKPISKERFDKSLSKWKETKDHKSIPSNLAGELIKHNVPTNRIVVKSGNNIRIIPIEEIHFIEAYDDYIKVHIADDVFLKKQTMQQTEDTLDTKKFVRVHRSYILKLNEITKIEAYGKESHIAILKSGQQIPLSKTGYIKLKSVLGI